MQVKKQQSELDMEQWTDSKTGEGYLKTVYCTLLIYLICRVHHEKRWAGRSTSWNQVPHPPNKLETSVKWLTYQPFLHEHSHDVTPLVGTLAVI